MCTRAWAALASASAIAIARSSAAGGREARKSAYREDAAAARTTSGSSACSTNSAGTDAAPAAARPADNGGNSATPESMRNALNPKTPASCSSGSSAALPGTAPPQNPTSTWHCPRAAACLARSAVHRHGRRDRVQRHVDDRGHPAGRGGAGRRGEPLPLGTARLVHVHVGVDQPGQQRHLAEVLDRPVADVGVVVQDGGDPPVEDADRRRPFPVGQHHPPRPQQPDRNSQSLQG